jgi:endoglycosylceramidase
MKHPAPLLLALALAPGCGGGVSSTSTGAGGGPDAGVCSLSAPAPPDTRLRAEGTRFRDALGRVVVLRGVNAGGRSKFAPFAPFDYADGGYDAALAAYLDRAAAWGIDALRVPLTWAAVEPTQGADDEAFLKRYDALLDAAWARGMYTVIDFHQDVYAEVFCGDGFPAWTVPDPKPAPHHDCPHWSAEYFSDAGVAAAFDAFWADGSPVQAAYGQLWDRLATRYKDRPGVVGFELFNEPGWGSQDLDTFEATTLTTFYTTMTARLRQTAPSTLVFFDATGPDAGILHTSVGRPAGDGLVFAPHYYQVGALGGVSGNADKVQADLQAWQNYANGLDVPVLLGEFGIQDAAADTAAFLTAHFDALDALGMSGTQWEYSVSKDVWNAELFGLVDADGTEEATVEAIVRAYPRAVAGDAVAFAFDAATRGFTLSYAPLADAGGKGVTEVAMPTRLYPNGYDVKITGGCADASTAGRLLVQADAGAAKVDVTVTAR